MRNSWRIIVAIVLLGLSGHARYAGGAAVGFVWPEEWQADSAFYDVWARADAPVAAGAVARSWLWGPEPFAVANEAYAESPSGTRLVEYLDKARMEVNDPLFDRTSPWFVTSGLLVTEMVRGQVQAGNNVFEPRAPSDLPVAGDALSQNAPTYRAFARNMASAPKATGTIVRQKMAQDGTVTTLAPNEVPSDMALFGLSSYDEVTKHNVPGVFARWMSQRGKVLERGYFRESTLLDPLYVVGRPITEPYWADIIVANAPARVLVQLFERRALTYNPNNAPEWRVEMANVGRAYYDWRYKDTSLTPAVSGQVGALGLTVRGWNWQPSSSVRVGVEQAGAAGQVAGPLDVVAGAAGRFNLTLPMTPQLQGVLQSGGNVLLRATAEGQQATVQIGGKLLAGKVAFDGVVTQMSIGTSQAISMHVRTFNDIDYSIAFGSNARLSSSEGTISSPGGIKGGDAVRVEGSASRGVVSAESIQVLSSSRTGAQLGYEWSEGSLTLTGTGWPGEKKVTLGASSTISPTSNLTMTTADSRGNLLVRVKAPAIDPSGMWLHTVSGTGTTLVRVTVPLYAPDAQPNLFLQRASGEQMGGVGTYCNSGRCTDAIGTPLGPEPLTVAAGEVLGMRAQARTGINNGLSPETFTVQLFSLSGASPDQKAVLGDTLYFAPSSPPLFSTGEIPGRPFIVALPPSLARGDYALLVNAKWGGASSEKATTFYGFNVRIP